MVRQLEPLMHIEGIDICEQVKPLHFIDDVEIVESLQRFVSMIQYNKTGKDYENVAKVASLLELCDFWSKAV